MLKKGKSQAALEFLVTYGWAFLVILIMIAALSYFGVLDPSKYLPDKCMFGSGLGVCQDFDIIGNSIVFKLVNNFGENVNLATATVQVSGLATACSPMNVSAESIISNISMTPPNITRLVTAVGTWNTSGIFGFNVSCSISGIQTNERPTAKVTFTYVPVGKSYAKTVEGDISIRK